MTLLSAVLAVGVIAVGAAVGSFINTVADRLPRDQSLIWPLSHCPACGRRLSPLELIPVVSYLFLRGRCRTCRASIGRRTLAVELGGGLTALIAWLLYGCTPAALAGAVYGWTLTLLCVLDLEHRWVPREVVVPCLLFALAASPWWPPSAGPARAVMGGLVCLLPYAALYVVAGRVYGWGKALGRGDVYVAVLMGVIAGFPGAVVALYATVIVGGVVASVLLVLRRVRRGDAIPTMPFIAAGTAVAVMCHRAGLMAWTGLV